MIVTRRRWAPYFLFYCVFAGLALGIAVAYFRSGDIIGLGPLAIGVLMACVATDIYLAETS